MKSSNLETKPLEGGGEWRWQRISPYGNRKTLPSQFQGSLEPVLKASVRMREAP